ncbi:hypothetical protein C7974DRAFT_235961 [Boeremia exigua]|uniref:uncharacterized protein n=1 Tax=Boeremia exigua TaxID=749465 RepID=UPI001E8DA86C|nr:uncharacterized protein C7974DRAFT_235961 [Boeremia exigua]KAH6620549.1 hypothetical protein C7974DRAFT_235961 [Boeremia exigua]
MLVCSARPFFTSLSLLANKTSRHSHTETKTLHSPTSELKLRYGRTSRIATMTARTAGKTASPDGHSDQVPSQEDYLRDLSLLKSEPVALPDTEITCGICLDPFTESTSGPTDDPPEHKDTVALKPCKHFFHYTCIMRWHTSHRPERATCPNCRTPLFTAAPLTNAQIAELHSSLEQETLVYLAPNDILVPFDLFVLGLHADAAVDQEIAKVQGSRVWRRGAGHAWVALCASVRDATMHVQGELRAVFQPHRDTFVMAVVAAVVVVSVTRHEGATEWPAFGRLVGWLDRLIDGYTEEEFRVLYGEFREKGLWMTNCYFVGRGGSLFVRARVDAKARVRSVSAEIEGRTEVSRWKGLGRRIAHLTMSELVPGGRHLTSRTLLGVLSRMTEGEPPDFLSYMRGGRWMDGDELDFGWDDALVLQDDAGLDTPPAS